MPSTTADGAAVAHREAHPGPTDEVEPARRLRRRGPCCRRSPPRPRRPRDRARARRHATAREALADVVVGLADERQVDGLGRRTRRRTDRLRRATSSRTGPRSSPRSTAPVRLAPNERSPVPSRSPEAVDGTLAVERSGDPRPRAAMRRRAGSGAPLQRVGAARRVRAPRAAPTTAANSRGRAPAPDGGAVGSRRRPPRRTARRSQRAPAGGPRRWPGRSAPPSRACR